MSFQQVVPIKSETFDWNNNGRNEACNNEETSIWLSRFFTVNSSLRIVQIIKILMQLTNLILLETKSSLQVRRVQLRTKSKNWIQVFCTYWVSTSKNFSANYFFGIISMWRSQKDMLQEIHFKKKCIFWPCKNHHNENYWHQTAEKKVQLFTFIINLNRFLNFHFSAF